MLQIPTVEISYSKVHKDFREETKVHSTKKDNNPKHPTSKKKVFLIPNLMIHSSLSTGHKHVGHLKKKSKHTHTHILFHYNYCTHPPKRMLLSFSNPEASEGSKGNERDALGVKNESTEV